MVHCGSIRQTASIVNMSKECLRTGDKAHVKFRFIKHPEYIRPGQRMVFREGRTKAVGNVLKPITNSQAAQNRPKPNKMQSRAQGQGQGSSQHNIAPQNQNQNPNVQAAVNMTNKTPLNAVADNDLKNHKTDGVLEVAVDKRDNSRMGNKRNKRAASGSATSNETTSQATTTTNNTTNPQHIAGSAKVQ